MAGLFKVRILSQINSGEFIPIRLTNWSLKGLTIIIEAFRYPVVCNAGLATTFIEIPIICAGK